ncbi:hypothetical protein AAFF_G00026650 [Aldrovandia affinis]|uniref:G-protein coupled receptors family 1 profile domain-containing protein n=1 Tax=Aldrovandia affinis TaxID=143900 RepID=A0AAD7S4S9_9TELE|nr:hypothetical protein AAFF_G00026650 [Aldrovandia affinis]
MDSAYTAVASSPQTSTDYYYYYDGGFGNDSLVFLDEDKSQRFGGTFSGVLYSLIFLLSLVGNCFLLWALLRREDLRKTTNIFLLQLTVSNLLLTLTLPFWAVYHLQEWVFGQLACHLTVGVFFLGFYSYMTFLAAMTVDRYIAVVHAVPRPQVRTPRRFALTSTALWLVCIAASVPDAIYSETKDDSHNGKLCQPTPLPLHLELLGYFLQIGVFFFLPFAIILFCYCRIWATILRCRSSRRHHAIRLIFFIVVGFISCWAPYNIVLLLSSLRLLGCPALMGPGAAEKLGYSYYVCHALAYCHCFLNPALHIFGGGKFRSYLSLVHRSAGRLSSQNSMQRGSASHQTFV